MIRLSADVVVKLAYDFIRLNHVEWVVPSYGTIEGSSPSLATKRIFMRDLYLGNEDDDDSGPLTHWDEDE